MYCVEVEEAEEVEEKVLMGEDVDDDVLEEAMLLVVVEDDGVDEFEGDWVDGKVDVVEVEGPEDDCCELLGVVVGEGVGEVLEELDVGLEVELVEVPELVPVDGVED